jgi:hypothetical protein
MTSQPWWAWAERALQCIVLSKKRNRWPDEQIKRIKSAVVFEILPSNSRKETRTSGVRKNLNYACIQGSAWIDMEFIIADFKIDPKININHRFADISVNRFCTVRCAIFILSAKSLSFLEVVPFAFLGNFRLDFPLIPLDPIKLCKWSSTTICRQIMCPNKHNLNTQLRWWSKR